MDDPHDGEELHPDWKFNFGTNGYPREIPACLTYTPKKKVPPGMASAVSII